jgi:vacuolar protein sorting-associated protein 35
VALCSNLFWSSELRLDGKSLKDGQKVNECLRKCLKIASQCVDTNAQFELHVEILNYYLYFYKAKNEQITLDMLNELISKIKQDSTTMDKSAESHMILNQFERTSVYLKENSSEQSDCFYGVNL